MQICYKHNYNANKLLDIHKNDNNADLPTLFVEV